MGKETEKYVVLLYISSLYIQSDSWFTTVGHWLKEKQMKRTCTMRKSVWIKLMCGVDVIYQVWDAVFHYQVKQREESWKYDAQQSIFDEFWGVSSGDESLCQMLDITSQTKWFYKDKLRMQKWAVFFLISKHSLNINFLCIFFMIY